MSAQSGILPPPGRYARFLVLRQRDPDAEVLRYGLQQFAVTRHRLQTQAPEAQLSSVVAFGPDLWRRLQHDIPAGLHTLAPISGAFEMPAVPADVLIHIHSERFDLCFELAQALLAALGDAVEVLDERACFRFRDGRDLTGFIDGTENPQTLEERANAALITDSEYSGGSFVFAQRYVHHLDKWHRLKVDAQEQVIGRTKLESIELDDDSQPKNSHVSRTIIEENGEERKILRHSLPYGDAAGEQGLFFIAYTQDLSIIDRMLSRMFGDSGDGISDRLLNFVTPVDGAYFFAPSEELLAEVVGEA